MSQISVGLCQPLQRVNSQKLINKFIFKGGKVKKISN